MTYKKDSNDHTIYYAYDNNHAIYKYNYDTDGDDDEGNGDDFVYTNFVNPFIINIIMSITCIRLYYILKR